MSIKNKGKGVKAVAWREVKRLSSRPIYLFSMVLAPLFCYFFFVSLMQSGLPTELPVAVVDLDGTSVSRNVIRQLDVFSQSKVVLRAANFAEARADMQRGKVYGIFVIPPHFRHNLVNRNQPKVTFYTNYSYLVAGSLVFRDMKSTGVLVSGSANRQVQLAKGENPRQVMTNLQPIIIDTHPLGNPWMSYAIYLNNILLPGILQLMILMITVFSIGVEIKEKTAKQWLATGGDSMTASLLGKLLPHTLIFSVMGILFQVILYRYMNFPLKSGIAPMALAMMLLVLSSQALGVFMISLLPVLRLGLSSASLMGVISFSITGFSFPVYSMHPVLQVITKAFPLRHYFLIYVDQALNGISMYYSRYDYLALMFFLLLPLPLLSRLKQALKYKEYKM